MQNCAYCFNKTNGQYAGTQRCQIDPVRSEREGKEIYLLPGNSTWIAPPEFNTETQVCTWDGTVWSVMDIPEPEPVPDPEPTQLDLIEAQVAYTAMMTDTLLEV